MSEPLDKKKIYCFVFTSTRTCSSAIADKKLKAGRFGSRKYIYFIAMRFLGYFYCLTFNYLLT